MNRIVNRFNLDKGIQYWLDQKPWWGNDFHNKLYRDLPMYSRDGLTPQWWERIFRILSEWGALRGQKTWDEIRERGQHRLQPMDQYYQEMKLGGALALDLATADWTRLSQLFATSKEIKGALSPMFASKLCHFIFPNLYVVVDNTATGIQSNEYSNIWYRCRTQWLAAPNKAELIELLTSVILQGTDDGPLIERTVVPNYPWSTKITELCLTGYRHSNNSKR